MRTLFYAALLTFDANLFIYFSMVSCQFCFLFWVIWDLSVYLQSIGGKREEFRRYLEKCGVMDALTRILVSLYEETEKPADALEYPCLIIN